MRIFYGKQLNTYGLLRLVRGGEDIVIKPTLRCNLACDYCGAEMPGSACWTMPAPDRPLGEWIYQFETDIFPRYWPRIRQVGISGGEPFMYRDIVDMVDWLTSQRIPVYIFSNLMFREGLKIKKSNYVKIRATFHADAPRIYGDKAIERFRENLREYRKKFLVYSQELIDTWTAYPEYDKKAGSTIEGSLYREKKHGGELNRLTVDLYGPDGRYYPKDEAVNKEKYDRWRKECEGLVANPAREKLLQIQ